MKYRAWLNAILIAVLIATCFNSCDAGEISADDRRKNVRLSAKELESKLENFHKEHLNGKELSMKEWMEKQDNKKELWYFNDKDLKEFMDEKGVETTNDFEIKEDAYKKAKMIADQMRAREAPFCMTQADLSSNTKLDNFQEIFRHDKFKNNSLVEVAGVNHDVDDASRNKWFGALTGSMTNYVTHITLERILAPEPSVYNLRQWLHVNVTVKDLVGIYIQPMSAPLGLPFAEIRIDFDCADCPNGEKTTSFESQTSVIPCSYRPRNAVRHPTVYVYGGKRLSKKAKRKQFHFHMNFPDVLCSEVTRIQMLIVAVKSFEEKDFAAFLSPVYERTKPDSYDGVPYPYIAEFGDRLLCHTIEDKSERILQKDAARCSTDSCKADAIYLQNSNDVIGLKRMYINKDYDECVRWGIVDGHECPPDVLNCADKGQVQNEAWKGLRQKINEEMPPCDPCEISVKSEPYLAEFLENQIRSSTIGIVGSQSALDQDIAHAAVLNIRKSTYTHAVLMIIALFFANALSQFIARFCKETGSIADGSGCCGIPCWLWWHILLSFLTVTLIWIGTVNVLIPSVYHFKCKEDIKEYPAKTNGDPKDLQNLTDACKNMEGISVAYHKAIGAISIFLIHVQFFTGWIRPANRSVRKSFIWIHTICGYLANVLGVIACVTTGVTPEILIFVCSLIVVNVVAYCVATVFVVLKDRKANRSSRNHMPVLESSDSGQWDNWKIFMLVIQVLVYISIIAFIITMYWEYYGSLKKEKTAKIVKLQSYITDDLSRTTVSVPGVLEILYMKYERNINGKQ